MKVIDVTPISLKDWDIVKYKLGRAAVAFKVNKNDLVIIDETKFVEVLIDDSELDELLHNMEETLY